MTKKVGTANIVNDVISSLTILAIDSISVSNKASTHNLVCRATTYTINGNRSTVI